MDRYFLNPKQTTFPQTSTIVFHHFSMYYFFGSPIPFRPATLSKMPLSFCIYSQDLHSFPLLKVLHIFHLFFPGCAWEVGGWWMVVVYNLILYCNSFSWIIPYRFCFQPVLLKLMSMHSILRICKSGFLFDDN